eukprot:scaffold33817_cov160-Skeletonema_menzelii.AAC.2
MFFVTFKLPVCWRGDDSRIFVILFNITQHFQSKFNRFWSSNVRRQGKLDQQNRGKLAIFMSLFHSRIPRQLSSMQVNEIDVTMYVVSSAAAVAKDEQRDQASALASVR